VCVRTHGDVCDDVCVFVGGVVWEGRSVSLYEYVFFSPPPCCLPFFVFILRASDMSTHTRRAGGGVGDVY
jgi:hypothetical protein